MLVLRIKQHLLNAIIIIPVVPFSSVLKCDYVSGFFVSAVLGHDIDLVSVEGRSRPLSDIFQFPSYSTFAALALLVQQSLDS